MQHHQPCPKAFRGANPTLNLLPAGQQPVGRTNFMFPSLTRGKKEEKTKENGRKI
jgi:hypothetical protein